MRHVEAVDGWRVFADDHAVYARGTGGEAIDLDGGFLRVYPAGGVDCDRCNHHGSDEAAYPIPPAVVAAMLRAAGWRVEEPK